MQFQRGKREQKSSPRFSERAWTLFTDGSSTSQTGGAGVILTSPEGFKVQQAIRFQFPVTNNEAEYEALIAGVTLAHHLEVKIIEIFSDSQLVVKQIMGEFKTTNERMASYMQLTTQLLQSFVSWTINNIERSANCWADALSKLTSASTVQNPEPIYLKDMLSASITEARVNVIEEKEDWRTPILKFINGTLEMDDKANLRRVTHKAQNYCVMGGALYRRALTEPLLRCIGPDETEMAMTEIHSGICGNHVSARSMALKIIRHGVFWPTMQKDCKNFTKKCKPCQMYGVMNHRPAIPLSPTAPPCPFFMWGMDLVGPLPKSSGQRQYIIVAIDYSTKWVEAKALARIRETEVIQFFMEFIVFRFGVPRTIVTDNGTQFVGKDFESTMEQLKIKHVKASVAYPQANGQVEITNKAMLQGIKKRLLEVKGCWTDELPNVLWGYRTTPHTSTGETPFKLAYGTEAVLPMEVSLGSFRIESFDPKTSEQGLLLDTDLLEETRDAAHFRVVQYQRLVAKYYNTKIKPRSFQVNDLVLRESAASMPSKVSKLSPPWEGPYKVIQVVRPGTYRLEHLDGTPILNAWNAVHLKKFYP